MWHISLQKQCNLSISSGWTLWYQFLEGGMFNIGANIWTGIYLFYPSFYLIEIFGQGFYLFVFDISQIHIIVLLCFPMIYYHLSSVRIHFFFFFKFWLIFMSCLDNYDHHNWDILNWKCCNVVVKQSLDLRNQVHTRHLRRIFISSCNLNLMSWISI